jgi:uncharacterized membrane protein YfcA
MKILLRVIAVWFGLGGVVVALLLLHLGTIGVSSSRAAAAFVLLIAFGALGLYSAVQLWRLRESGRKAALAVCLVGLAFAFAQFNSLSWVDTGRLAALGIVMLLLLSPRARQACQPQAPRQPKAE